MLSWNDSSRSEVPVGVAEVFKFRAGAMPAEMSFARAKALLSLDEDGEKVARARPRGDVGVSERRKRGVRRLHI